MCNLFDFRRSVFFVTYLYHAGCTSITSPLQILGVAFVLERTSQHTTFICVRKERCVYRLSSSLSLCSSNVSVTRLSIAVIVIIITFIIVIKILIVTHCCFHQRHDQYEPLRLGFVFLCLFLVIFHFHERVVPLYRLKPFFWAWAFCSN